MTGSGRVRTRNPPPRSNTFPVGASYKAHSQTHISEMACKTRYLTCLCIEKPMLQRVPYSLPHVWSDEYKMRRNSSNLIKMLYSAFKLSPAEREALKEISASEAAAKTNAKDAAERAEKIKIPVASLLAGRKLWRMPIHRNKLFDWTENWIVI